MREYFTDETREKVFNNQINKIKKKFPFKFSDDIILDLYEINPVLRRGGNIYNLMLVDNSGYKYKCEYHHLLSASKNYQTLNRFFKRNPFTKDNINNFLKLNNLNLVLNNDILNSNESRKNLEFVNFNNEIITATWNQIQRYPDRYKDDYQDKLKEAQEARTISKEEAINIIYKMQSKLNRPLNSKDFRVKQNNGIGIRTVIKYWGIISNMQKELGLKITSDNSKIPHEEYKNELKYICESVYKNEKRKMITYNDFKKYGNFTDPSMYRIHCKKDGITLKQCIENLGFELTPSGTGFNYIFEDGEKTISFYEYEFSNVLRNIGLVYNKDYFRSTKYKTFDNDYNGNMDCDYLLNINGHKIYIEIAGYLGNSSYENAYRNNLPIKAKDKEKYRIHLNQKKEMFERNNLDYYILLKSELNVKTYQNILNKYIGSETYGT